MKRCKNPTCSAQASSTYCSRDCQLAMRTRSKGKQIPDLWVGMDDWRWIVRAAEAEGMTPRDWCQMTLANEARMAI